VALSTTSKSIQDIMRKDVGVDGDAQRIGQLVWLLFLKIWDDREQEPEYFEQGFVSPLVHVTWRENGDVKTADDLRWRAWAADPEGITGDKLLDFANNTLFPALKGMEVGPIPQGDDAQARSAAALRRRRDKKTHIIPDRRNRGSYPVGEIYELVRGEKQVFFPHDVEKAGFFIQQSCPVSVVTDRRIPA